MAFSTGDHGLPWLPAGLAGLDIIHSHPLKHKDLYEWSPRTAYPPCMWPSLGGPPLPNVIRLGHGSPECHDSEGRQVGSLPKPWHQKLAQQSIAIRGRLSHVLVTNRV